MRKKVKPPQPIQATSLNTISSSIAEIEDKAESLTEKPNPPTTSKRLLDEKTLTFNNNNSCIEKDSDDEKTTKKEPTKKGLFAKRGVAVQNNHRTHSTCTPSSHFSSSSSTKPASVVSRLACNNVAAVAPTAAAAAANSCSDAAEEEEESAGTITPEIPVNHLSSSSTFESTPDLNNNNNNQINLKEIPLKATKTSSAKSIKTKVETQSFHSSRYSVAGSQISLISSVMDKLEKGKHNHLDESLASNRRLPEPLDEKKIALYAGIIALCVLTVIVLGIAAFMFFMT